MLRYITRRYATEDIERNAARELAKKLRASGKYLRVRVRTVKPDTDGRPFAAIYVTTAS